MTYEVGAAEVAGDEVEDLRALLAAVVAKMPSVRAVTSGAILSDYQRLRVEAVCADLGLVSLAYLWQQPQPRVLDLICDSNVHAVLVKVAAMGLEPKKHLGATLAAARPLLRKIEREFGSHCAGEGGELETLVLDCPLFRRARLEIDGTPGSPEIVVTSPDPYAPSGHLAVARDAAVIVAKPEAEGEPGDVIDVYGSAPAPRAARRGDAEAAEDARARGIVLGEAQTHAFSGTEAAAAHVRALVPATHTDDPAAAAAASAEAALRAAAATLGATFGASWADVDYVQLCVRDMRHFAAVNAAYVRVVPVHSPPSRACVELPLPEGVPATVELFASRRRGNERTEPNPQRRSLHVQSLSCWAPACIGPYAQAASRLGLCHLAGSIGMDPATLDIVGGGEDPKLEARRAWRSAAAVARAAGHDLARDVVAATVFVVGGRADPDAAIVARASDDALEAVLSRDRWVDEVDAPNGPKSAEAGVRVAETRRDADEDDELGFFGDPPLKNAWTPLVTRVRVPRLPKDAKVEVQPVLLDGAGPGVPVLKASNRRGEVNDDEADDDDASESDSETDPTRSRNSSVVSRDSERGGARFVKGRWCFARVAVARGDLSELTVLSALETLGGFLRDAGLDWAHAGTFRGYYAEDEKDENDSALKSTETEKKLAGWIARHFFGGDFFGAAEYPCALAPALAVGFGEIRDAGLVLELSAATRAR